MFFLEFPCFFYDLMDVGNLISGSSALSKSSLYIWKFSIHILLKDFEYCLANMWNEHNCAVVWTFFGIVFLWGWSVNWSFPVLWPLLRFPNSLVYWVQHFSGINRICNRSAGIPWPPIALFIEILPKACLTSQCKMFCSRWVTTPLWLSDG